MSLRGILASPSFWVIAAVLFWSAAAGAQPARGNAEGEAEAEAERPAENRIVIREGRARLRLQPGQLPDDLTDEQRQALIRRMLEIREQQDGVRLRVEGGEAYQPPDDLSRAMGPLKRLEARLTDPDLSVQRRAALIRDGRGVFSRAPRAALGVQFRTPAAEGAVTIERALDGFPVAEYLAGGDVITHVDGRPLAGTEHLRAEILSRLPGESLPMRVRRSIPAVGDPAMGDPPAGAQVLEIDVPLGGYEKLEQAGPDERLLHAAWRARVERLLDRAGIGEGPEVGAGLRAEDWLRNEGLLAEGADGPIGRAGDGVGIFGTVAPERILAVGGRPADAGQQTALRRSTPRAMLRDARTRGLGGRRPGTPEARTTFDRLRDAMDTFRVVSLELASYRTAIEQVRTGEAGDERVAERMDQLLRTVERLGSNLESLRREIATLQRRLDERAEAAAGPAREPGDKAAGGAGERTAADGS